MRDFSFFSKAFPLWEEIMSLNYKEINIILEELDLEGSYIQGIYQPTIPQLVIHFYKKKPISVLFSFEGENTRIHRTFKKHVNTIKLQRFPQLLRSRIMGALVKKVEQVKDNRIILFTLEKEGEEFHLWVRLWANQGNIILTDSHEIIIDCFYRKPLKGEKSGEVWKIPEAKDNKKEYSLRTTVFNNYNEYIEDYYLNKNSNSKEKDKEEKIKNLLLKRKESLEKAIIKIENELKENKTEKFKLWGDLLLSYYPAIKGDYISLEEESIPTEGESEVSELANLYFKRYKKSKEKDSFSHERMGELRETLDKINNLIKELEEENINLESFQESNKNLLKDLNTSNLQSSPKEKNNSVGLTFESEGFTLLVGRNAKENDFLLRKNVKSQDMWLHLRDFPGSYVFIKYKKEKSIPLNTLLDAGNLALFFSQKRKLKRADLYYTQVKYLKKPKGAKLGLVIPTQEKNLSITLDEERLKKLLSSHKDTIV